ncbi:MAG: hypothetical protein U0T84_12960 [Chitinophagales bacterium]
MSNQAQTRLLVALMVLALFPYIVLSAFAFPMADDFCFAWEASKYTTLWDALVATYKHWTGRYTAAALVLWNPFMHAPLWMYQTAAAGVIVSGVLMYRLLTGIFLEDKLWAWMAALSMQLLWLHSMPVLSEGVLWYNGYGVYYAGMVFFAALLYSLYRSARTAYWLLPAIAFMALAIGCNEPMALLVLWTLLLLRQKLSRQVWLLLFIIALSCTAMVVLAPGNSARAGHAPTSANWIKAIVMSHAQMIRFLAQWLGTAPMAIGLLIAAAHPTEQISRLLKGWSAWPFLLTIYITLLAAILLPYWFTGMLGQQRTLNVALAIIMPLSVLTVAKWSMQYQWHKHLSFLKGSVLRYTVASALVLALFTGNSAKIAYDFSTNTLPLYRAEKIQRHRQLMQQQDDALLHTPIQHRPTSIFLYDESDPKIWWTVKCEAEYYQMKRAETTSSLQNTPRPE